MERIVLRRLRANDAAAFKKIRLQALLEHSEAFGASWEDENGQPESVVAERLENGHVIAGISKDGTIVGTIAGGDRILVTFPSGETERMAPGPSSELSKAVIEVFANHFLREPAVIFFSESRDKVVSRHDELARQIGLNILADKNLPDVILADLAPDHPRLVFVEVVSTDGPVSEQRKRALLDLTSAAGFPSNHIAFVTAYMDRSRAEFKKTVDSFAWFASEPDHLMHLEGDGELVCKRCFPRTFTKRDRQFRRIPLRH